MNIIVNEKINWNFSDIYFYIKNLEYLNIDLVSFQIKIINKNYNFLIKNILINNYYEWILLFDNKYSNNNIINNIIENIITTINNYYEEHLINNDLLYLLNIIENIICDYKFDEYYNINFNKNDKNIIYNNLNLNDLLNESDIIFFNNLLKI